MLYQIIKILSKCNLISIFILERISFLDLVSDGLLVGVSTDVLLGCHKWVDEVVDAFVQVGKVRLHILLLAVRILVLFVRVKVFWVVFLWSIGCSPRCLRTLIFSFTRCLICFIALRILIFLLHESLSSFEGFSFQVFGGLWEQSTKVIKLVSTDAHEVDLWYMIDSVALLPCSFPWQRFIN